MGVIVLNICLSYIEDLLHNLKTVPEKSTLIMDDRGNVVYKNGSLCSMKNATLVKLLNKPTLNFQIKLANQKYMVTQLSSQKYHWKYYFVIPTKIFYNVPNRLQQITILLLLCSFSLSLFLTYCLTKKTHNQITNIISIIDSAKNGLLLPEPPSSINDEFTYISYNLLKTFIEQNYLKVQLSERMYRLRFMELLALQSQINPHFLFNTLDTIKWKFIGYTKRQTEASKMLEELSEILKYLLKSPDSKELLAEELTNARNFIEIQKIRYKDQFDVIWQYDEDVLAYPIIRLVLQPLIENCIYHGIKEKDGKSMIKIKIHAHDSFLKISIIDDGLGIKRDNLSKIRSFLANDQNCSDHIGLFNTNKRLLLTYGETAAIHIRSKFGFGTVVYFQIPLA
jgi:two-component system sensor histidine kinase YesM